jgi:predicted dehydrogenase
MNTEGVSPLRIAIVGCGAVTRLYHLPAVAVSSQVVLTALVDPDVERAAALAETSGAPLALSDHRSLEGKVDAAIVAAPNRLHAPIARDLAAAGIHVLVEKPLGTTVAECEEIERAVAAAGVVGAVGHDFRHFPVAVFARDVLAAGILGPVQSADLYQSSGGRWPYASTYVYSRAQAGGGVLIDFGIHMIDLLCWWLGELSVESYRDDTVAGVETECELELKTATGAPVHFELTRLRAMRDTAIARCEHGVLEVGIFDPALVRVTLTAGRSLVGDVPDPAFAAAPLRTVFARQLADFVEAIRSGSRPLVPLSEGRRAVEIVERCYAIREPLRRPWDWPPELAASGAA